MLQMMMDMYFLPSGRNLPGLLFRKSRKIENPSPNERVTVWDSNQDLQLKGIDDSSSGDLQLKTGTDFFGTNPSPQGTLTNCKPGSSPPTGSAMAELQNAAGQSQAGAQASSPECAKADAAAAFTANGGGANTLKPFHSSGGIGPPALSDSQAQQVKTLLTQIQQLSEAMTKDQQSVQQAQEHKQTADQALQQAQQNVTQLQAQQPQPGSSSAPIAPDPNLAAAQQLLAQAQQNDQQAGVLLVSSFKGGCS